MKYNEDMVRDQKVLCRNLIRKLPFELVGK